MEYCINYTVYQEKLFIKFECNEIKNKHKTETIF